MATYQKRGDRWRAIVRKKGHPTVSETFSTKALAERWAKKTEHDMEAGQFAGDTATLSETVEEYCKRMRQIGKPVPYNKEIIIRRAARELGDDKSLAELTTDAIVDWIAGKKEVIPSTRQQYLIYFRTVLTTAETLWDAKPNMPAYEKAARFLRTHGIVGESNERDRRVSDGEIKQIIDHLPGARIPYDQILPFQLASAFRIGETCRLRWADIDEDNRLILIRQRKHPRKKRDEWAPLLGEAWDIVQRQPKNGEFIFPYVSDSVSAGVTYAVKQAKLDDLHLHDIRHEAISRLFEQGYGIAEVQLCSGHKDLKMLQRYLQLRPRDLHDGPIAVRRLREQQAATAA